MSTPDATPRTPATLSSPHADTLHGTNATTLPRQAAPAAGTSAPPGDAPGGGATSPLPHQPPPAADLPATHGGSSDGVGGSSVAGGVAVGGEVSAVGGGFSDGAGGSSAAHEVPAAAGAVGVTEGSAGRPPQGRGRPSPGRAMLRLLGSELGLTFRKPRNIAMLIVLACVPALIGVVLRAFGGDVDEEMPSLITQVAGNGLMLTFVALSLLLVMLLPLSVSVVAGDAIAGEAGGGTLRYLLTAPAGRTRLLAVKFANVTVYALVATSVVAAGALVTGLVLFPVGPITLLSGSTISVGEGLVRVLIVTGYTAAGMAALGAVGLAVSTLTEVPIGAVAATIVGVVFSHVLSAIPQLEPARPYLLTYWWSSFDGALRDPIATEGMTQGLLVYGAYILIALSIAWAHFTGRDITS
ncbi:ABC transporter permease [Sphaerisporangium sp. NPDC005288]|uniref:ABC transporter permease n=1 Tax=Sphaerisporangium sp. NPDC005288 TaxID=3155114 RepID=UPI0033AC30D9